jgi:hypothetical protein
MVCGAAVKLYACLIHFDYSAFKAGHLHQWCVDARTPFKYTLGTACGKEFSSERLSETFIPDFQFPAVMVKSKKDCYNHPSLKV